MVEATVSRAVDRRNEVRVINAKYAEYIVEQSLLNAAASSDADPSHVIAKIAYPLIDLRDPFYRNRCSWKYMVDATTGDISGVNLKYDGRKNTRYFFYFNRPQIGISQVQDLASSISKNEGDFRFVIEMDGFDEANINAILQPEWEPKAAANKVHRMVLTQKDFKPTELPQGYSKRLLAIDDYDLIHKRLIPFYPHSSFRKESLLRQHHWGFFDRDDILVGMLGFNGPYTTAYEPPYKKEFALLVDFVVHPNERDKKLGEAITSEVVQELLSIGLDTVIVADAISEVSKHVIKHLGAQEAGTYLWFSFRRRKSEGQ